MADDLAWGDLGCYGQRVIQTPHLDALAKEGVRFTNAYAGCSVCAPSRSVLFTGKHMEHTSVRANSGGIYLLDQDLTLGEVLQSAGYRTGCFGKWGLGDIGTPGVPWKQGFDDFFGYLHQAHAHYHYPPFLYENDRELPILENAGHRKGKHSHELVLERMLEFIRKNRETRFFCYAPWSLPHWEPQAPGNAMDPYRGRFLPEYEFEDRAMERLFPQKTTFAAYAGMVAAIDQGVGRMLSLLRELQLEENTMVVFTSDNGGASRSSMDPETRLENFGPFRGHKGTMYEGGLRVPMIVRWPSRTPTGRLSHYPWMFADVLPTLAEAAGAGTPAGLDGQSVLPTLTGGRQKPQEYLYWELPSFEQNTFQFQWNEVRERDVLPKQALRAGKWKLVRPKEDAPLELYNLQEDVGETVDLAFDEQERLEELTEVLHASRTETRPQSQLDHRWFDKPWW
jgi:arylsulfatase A